jgi:hypothetical protein
VALLGLLVIAGGAGCDDRRAPPAGPAIVAPADAASSVSPSQVAVDAGMSEAAAPESNALCPDDMLLVEGQFCPVAIQICLEHHPEYLKNRNKSERCLKFRKPTHCLSEQRHPMRFCIDRYEWPNKQGGLPLVLVQWLEAAAHCASVGKRLCDEGEWLFACEGEEMLPHVYGYERDDKKCLIDKPYVNRTLRLKRYQACLEDPKCKRELDKLDQRRPSGSFTECVSPFGVFDMNGSVNEWVHVPGRPLLHRSGLKGGWWGPVRNRCRPTVLFHKEDDWGYEAGFRCCKDALLPDGGVDYRRGDAGPPLLRPAPMRGERSETSEGAQSELEPQAAPTPKAPSGDLDGGS